MAIQHRKKGAPAFLCSLLRQDWFFEDEITVSMTQIADVRDERTNVK